MFSYQASWYNTASNRSVTKGKTKCKSNPFHTFRVLTIPDPKAINVIAFFMNQPLTDDQTGAVLYYSSPPEYAGMQFIGAIANARPSDIFHTGWSLNPDVNTLPEIKLIVSIEPLENVKT